MNPQAITITLSEQTYQRVQKRANQRNRTIQDELERVVEAALDDETITTAGIDQEIEQLAFLNDEHLWRAARLIVPLEKSNKVHLLLQKYKQEGLTENEQDELDHLQHFEHRIMLVRAEAAVLLQERGFDVSNLRASL
ncbi:MAG: hypothetical protein KC423_07925 [Anaerolineales bacterium]|nr:hypothetical protein [Anaerolineales bacterium]